MILMGDVENQDRGADFKEKMMRSVEISGVSKWNCPELKINLGFANLGSLSWQLNP